MENQQLQEFIRFSTEAVSTAGDIALKYFRHPLGVDSKGDENGFDPVTRADREIESFIRQSISRHFDGHSIVGEEEEDVFGSKEFRWIVDPIDGTRAFMSGSPLWGILLGLMNADQPVLGLMRQPYLNETYLGSSFGAFIKDGEKKQPIFTSQTKVIDEAILYCTHPSMFVTEDEINIFNYVAEQCRLMRYGGDCYCYCLLAQGFIDLVIEADLKPFDIIPLIPIIEQAGGVVSDWDGDTVLNGGNIVAAANPELHEKTLAMLTANR